MPDAYLENPSLLRGTPKLTIGDYAERNGILVPRRFATLDDALASGKPFIIRSEHTVEYDGPSDLADSYPITQKTIIRAQKYGADAALDPAATDIRTIKSLWKRDAPMARYYAIMQIGEAPSEHVIEQLKIANMEYSYATQSFCELTGYDKETFMRESAFSFWERLPGFNRSIIADSAVKGRYHIFTSKEKGADYEDSPYFVNYSSIDQRGVQLELLDPFTDEMRIDLPNVIAFYEKVRNLPNFDPNHCPIMEFQTVGTEHFFLQYHRTRDFDPTTFKLERELEAEEIKAVLVRGATPPEGVVVRTSAGYPEFYFPREKPRDWKGPSFAICDEDASFDEHDQYMFSEVMSRRRTAQFIGDNAGIIATNILGYHLSRSLMFKPKISVGVGWDQIEKCNEERKHMREEWKRTGIPPRIPIRVISDGTTCYVKRMDV